MRFVKCQHLGKSPFSFEGIGVSKQRIERRFGLRASQQKVTGNQLTSSKKQEAQTNKEVSHQKGFVSGFCVVGDAKIQNLFRNAAHDCFLSVKAVIFGMERATITNGFAFLMPLT